MDALAIGMPSKPLMLVEQKLDLSEWIVDGFGTADCILIAGDVLHVIDYKHGKGVAVDAEMNPQMALYALGALAQFELVYDIHTVRMSIIQPRIRQEPSTWECSKEDIITLGERFKERAQLAYYDKGEFSPGEKQCRFCKARAECKARADAAVSLAFGPAQTDPRLLNPNDFERYLKLGADTAKWLEDLQAYALKLCLSGAFVPGLKAVEGRGSREWSDPVAAMAAVEASGIPHAMLYETKPITLAAVEKLMGKKDFNATAGSYVIKKPGKPTLVSASDPREPYQQALPEEFQKGV